MGNEQILGPLNLEGHDDDRSVAEGMFMRTDH